MEEGKRGKLVFMVGMFFFGNSLSVEAERIRRDLRGVFFLDG